MRHEQIWLLSGNITLAAAVAGNEWGGIVLAMWFYVMWLLTVISRHRERED